MVDDLHVDAVARGKSALGRPPFSPLYLVRLHFSTLFHHQIDFGAGAGAPEVEVFPLAAQQVLPGEFGHDPIFPQSANVGPQRVSGQVVEQGIAYTGIPEEDLLALVDLLARIGAEGGQAKNDESLFEQIEIADDGRPGNAEIGGQFR